MTQIAIIGTAGRDKSIRMSRALWDWMCKDAATRVQPDDRLVSGGAAWADHLAVALFLAGAVRHLTLHLPAPFEHSKFLGPRQSAGSAANYYHERFSAAIGERSLEQLVLAISHPNCEVTYEPEAAGYGGMFARNKKVATADEMVAYTFGTGDAPADGGTRNTWDQCKGRRVHVPLPRL